ncbi:MAG: secondary thiamine-phosphate synthase enzyme YjbQ, partial [Patescibacteria group bacterium]|nr:secondary thiamine-phosphate synthase enzyme YjbQ [Patescibacteria group bacterium]
NHIISLETKTTLDFIDITEKIQEVIKNVKIENGVVNIQSLHTTMAIIVNEAEPLLIKDIKKMLDRIAPRTIEYMHDNFEIRTVNMCDGECRNGHSHCKSICLASSQMLNIVKNSLQLGKWQRVFAIELDRSRPRKIALQILGN